MLVSRFSCNSTFQWTFINSFFPFQPSFPATNLHTQHIKGGALEPFMPLRCLNYSNYLNLGHTLWLGLICTLEYSIIHSSSSVNETVANYCSYTAHVYVHGLKNNINRYNLTWDNRWCSSCTVGCWQGRRPSLVPGVGDSAETGRGRWLPAPQVALLPQEGPLQQE